jgi:alanyl-tRNA synthetase
LPAFLNTAVESRVAHTAEHAFIGALQKLLGQTLSVRKVEHKKEGNTAFIAIQNLDVGTVVRAEAMVNDLIAQGRAITAHTYPSLEEAKLHNPGLRANEERIIAGEVRVVEIEGHDVTACAMEHVENLHACEFFLATRLSRSGSEYEVDFVVGKQAKEAAVALSAKMMRVCEELGANQNTVEATAKKMRSEAEANLRKLRILSREKLAGVASRTNGAVAVFSGAFSGLADDQMIEFAGEKIATPGTVVAVANVGPESAYFVFARSEAMDLDCNKVFREIAGADGRGGGKPHFVTGVIKKERAAEIVSMIAERALRLN